MRTHDKVDKNRQSGTDYYLIDGKWITAEERAARISRHEAKLSQIEQSLRICGQAWGSTGELVRLAKAGNKLAVTVLWDIACDLVSNLNSIAEKHSKLVHSISRNTPFWPSLISRKRASKQYNAKLMDALQLGEGDVYSTKKWQIEAPSTQAAIVLFVTAQVNARTWHLPPLTKKNKRIWFDASWNDMLKEGIVPEDSPLLSQLGRSAIGKKSVSRGMADQTEGMKRDDMRAEIKRQVWKAFDRLIAGAPGKK
jgi:hypothetical protein